MEDFAREAKNAYMREWRKKNPEKQRAINQRYWQKRSKQMSVKGETE